MAGHEDTAKPRANGYAADGPADDLSVLLDSLAHEIRGAGERHTEALHDMQGRVAALSDRASTAKPSMPHEYSAAIGRIEAAMSSFSEKLTDAEPRRAPVASPTHDADDVLPEAVRAELKRAIMNAQRSQDDAPISSHAEPYHAFGESGEEVAAPAATLPPPPTPAHTVIEPSWLEARFADIAERVEQSLAAHNPHNALLTIGARFDQFEQRFDRALVEITARPGSDPDALKSVERQIGELAAEIERAQRQLGRLDTIESRLTDLRQSHSDEEITRLVGTLTPTEEKLTAVATAAAERVAASLRSEPQPAPSVSAMSSDPRLVELTAMLDAFIGEQRQGDAQTAEALDTMQQAMQHLIDRVEAIETAQISNHDALMRQNAALAESQESRVFAVRTPEPARTARTELADPPAIDFDAIDSAEQLAQAMEPPPAPSRARDEVRGLPPNLSPAGGELDRQALVAMARRAAEKVSSETPPTPRPAGGRSLPRPNVLLVASFAAFLLAGLWLVAGPSLRGFIPSFGLGATRSGDASHVIETPVRMTVATASEVPTERAAAAPEEAEPSEKVQMASLSGPADPLPSRAAPVPTTTADLMNAIGQGTQSPASAAVPAMPELPAMSRSVEMPPALLGPLSMRQAAAKGDPRAQFEVAARFAEGKGIPQDFAQAATWYQRAAAQGLATAQYRLGTLYERGLGVVADPARARVWYGRAAEQGNVRAMHNLAVLSAGRPGVRPDYAAAVQWFTEAANRGLADSQYNLGILYESGLGVPANNIEAYKWYALAARSGDKDANKRRDAVRMKLDSPGLKAADALVIQWRAMAVEGEANDARVAGQSWQAVRK
jgi:localization factor PodJL